MSESSNMTGSITWIVMFLLFGVLLWLLLAFIIRKITNKN